MQLAVLSFWAGADALSDIDSSAAAGPVPCLWEMVESFPILSSCCWSTCLACSALRIVKTDVTWRDVAWMAAVSWLGMLFVNLAALFPAWFAGEDTFTSPMTCAAVVDIRLVVSVLAFVVNLVLYALTAREVRRFGATVFGSTRHQRIGLYLLGWEAVWVPSLAAAVILSAGECLPRWLFALSYIVFQAISGLNVLFIFGDQKGSAAVDARIPKTQVNTRLADEYERLD
jgi:hypothetical protein